MAADFPGDFAEFGYFTLPVAENGREMNADL